VTGRLRDLLGDSPGLNLIAGLLAGVVLLVTLMSNTALIYAGPLNAYLADGLNLIFASAFVIGVVVTLLSSSPIVVATPQSFVAPIMGLLAASLTASPELVAQPETLFATLIAAFVVTTLLTGLFLLSIGLFRLGDLIRFIPYPVIGGFLAGVGWVLVVGSLQVMSEDAIARQELEGLLSPSAIGSWLPGLAVALGLTVLYRRYRNGLLIPAVLVAACLLFYLTLAALGYDFDQAAALGWTLGPFAESRHLGIDTVALLGRADWSMVLGQFGNILTVLLVSTVALLLNSTALEMASERDLDLNRELRVTGLANLLTGSFGGMVGFHAISHSQVAMRVGGRSRIVGLTAAAMALAALLAGPQLVAWFPRGVLGGMLMFLGLGFMIDWLVDGRRRMSTSDYSVVLLIVASVAFVGFLEGIAVGIVAAVVLFVVNYSRIDVIKHELSGAQQSSHVERRPSESAYLKTSGEAIRIVKLQGFLFFGTASRLLRQLQLRINDPGETPVRFIVLDFRRVTGIDSSVALSLTKLRRIAEQHAFEVILTHLPQTIRQLIEGAGIDLDGDPVLHALQDLDFGIEWCEDRLLTDLGAAGAGDGRDRLTSLLDDALDSTGIGKRLMPFLERRAWPEGDTLIRQGEAADALYFIERGEISVNLASESDGGSIRLRKMGPGTVVGELGLYIDVERTATVTANRPTTTYRLDREALERMQREAPELAAAFHGFMCRLLAERLVNTNKTLRALLD
jgi:SulP family sulfate permease